MSGSESRPQDRRQSNRIAAQFSPLIGSYRGPHAATSPTASRRRRSTRDFAWRTAAEVTPVSEIGPYRFTPGKVCRTLIADFATAVTPQKAAAE